MDDKVCIPCNLVMDGDICTKCNNPNAPWRQVVEFCNGRNIIRYSYEKGYRVDNGTIRTKEVDTVEDARALIDCRENR